MTFHCGVPGILTREVVGLNFNYYFSCFSRFYMIIFNFVFTLFFRYFIFSQIKTSHTLVS